MLRSSPGAGERVLSVSRQARRGNAAASSFRSEAQAEFVLERAQRAGRERGGRVSYERSEPDRKPRGKKAPRSGKKARRRRGGSGGSAPRLEQEQIAAHTVSVEDRARMIECGLGARERPTTTSTAAFAEATIFPFLRDACVAPKNLISTYLGSYLVWRSLG